MQTNSTVPSNPAATPSEWNSQRRKGPRTLAPAAVAFALALGSVVLLGLAGCAQKSDDSGRQQRLDKLVVTTERAVKSSQAFGHDLDVLRAVRSSLETIGAKSMVVTSDGGLHVQALRAYHQWNSTAQGRGTSRATDFDDPSHPIHEIVARAEKLRAEGIDYLFVQVPSRLEIYPELLVPNIVADVDFPGMNPGTLAFQAELARRGVETVPLLGAFAQNRFGPDGSRWLALRTSPALTPGAIFLCALQIADSVKAMDWFQAGDATEGIDFLVQDRSIRQTAPLPPELAGLPGFETPDNLKIQAVLTPEDIPAHVVDRESPIVLLGDSVVSLYDQLGGDLASQLYRILGQRIDVVSAPHGDYWLTLERRPDPFHGKRLVIEVQSTGFRLPATPHEPIPSE